MKRIIQIILAAIGLCSGCSKSPILTPAQFTEQFTEAMLKSFPEVKIEVVRDLELKVTCPDGNDFASYLYNAYAAYKQEPKAKADIIQLFVVANEETICSLPGAIDPNLIVPVIKDRLWLEETRQALLDRGAKEVPVQVYEDFNADLVILYAEDSPKNISYLTPKDLEDAKIDRKELRRLACENLKRLIPNIELNGGNGLYMITGGEGYEASLLLFDSIWSSKQMEVRGDIVVAIPTRDILLVTGSQEQEGIKKVKQIVQEAYREGSYHLTPKLFVYRNGVFEEFGNCIE